MSKIVVIATHPELAEQAHKLAGFETRVVQARLEAGVAAAEQAIRQGAQVLVSRGVTCRLIAAAMPHISLIELKFTGFDILRAFLEATAISGEVALVDRPEIINGMATIEAILDTNKKTHKIILDDYRDYRQGVIAAAKAGAECIIGNQAVIHEAQMCGLRGVLLRSGPEGISQGLLLAEQMLTIHHIQETNARQIEAIINSVDYGIIAVDKEGVVTAANRQAKDLLQLKEETLSNHSVYGKLLQCMQRGEDVTGTVEKAQANRELVINYLPIKSNGEITGAVATMQELRHFQDIERRTRQELARRGRIARYSFFDIETKAASMHNVISDARRFARYDATVLIQGETGAGKEYFAHAIHQASTRRDGPFVAVNCAAIPETVLESELFGYAEGAFTGAKKGGKTGLFEQAHNGTIFLDEIGEMDELLQTRLLRVLQEHEVYRIGDDRIIPVDIRVIAATNRNLRGMVKAGRFREDLYYRLDVLTLDIPPLRQRKADIAMLVSKFICEYNQKYHTEVSGIANDGLELLMLYDWPGNIRELYNAVGRMMALADQAVLTGDDVRHCLQDRLQAAVGASDGEMKAAEAAAIQSAMLAVGGSKAKAAELLGIGRSTLWRKLKELENSIDVSK